MSILEKINIYVPRDIGNKLRNDALMFEVLKADGQSINMNRFLSMLIVGYYDDYISECHDAVDATIEILEMNGVSKKTSAQIADKVLEELVLPKIPARKGKSPMRLSLKPTNETEGLIISIMDSLGSNDYTSQYFCRMLMKYCEKPFSSRERILFSEKYKKLIESCKNQRVISFSTIWNKQKLHTVIPYCMTVGEEEMFNYLLCCEIDEQGNQRAQAYRLNRIDKINYSGKPILIDSNIEKYLEMMLKYGPQYAINDDEETCVKLSEYGRKSFNRIYYGRPKYERIEKDGDYYNYYFKGSKDQIFFYFRRFGCNEAEIISPLSLRERMKQFHIKSLETYNQQETNHEQQNI